MQCFWEIRCVEQPSGRFQATYWRLRSVLKAEPKLPLHSLWLVMEQICAGLGALHRADIIHNDLSAANVLRDEHGVVTICDFGCSIVNRPGWRGAYTPSVLKQSGVQEITLWYRAPEVVLGMANYDASVDVWSAGCIYGEGALGKVRLYR
jgi:serine/threonine protein kinase